MPASDGPTPFLSACTEWQVAQCEVKSEAVACALTAGTEPNAARVIPAPAQMPRNSRAENMRTPLLSGASRDKTGHRLRHRCQRGADRCFPVAGRQGEALGANDRDVVDADEAEDRAQVGFLKIVCHVRHTRGVKAAARRGDDELSAACQAQRPGFGIAEGLTGDQDAVDPGLELARDCEVVHRRADVGGEELLEGRFALLVAELAGAVEAAGSDEVKKNLTVEVRYRLRIEIAPGDAELR